MPRSSAKSAFARTRTRDGIGRFVPDDASDALESGVTRAVPPRLAGFRERVDARWTELCDSVINQAIQGDRWALEHVFRYAVGDWRLFDDEADENSKLAQYLSDIRAAMNALDGDGA